MHVFRAATLLGGALAICLASPGCAPQRDKRAERRPDLPKRFDEPEPPRPVVAVRKIAFDDGQVLGYLKVHEDVVVKGKPARTPARVYWVHDSYFKVLGFYTDRGETFRVLPNGGFQDLGVHDVDTLSYGRDEDEANDLDEGGRILLRAPRDLRIRVMAMDAPRTLESDDQRARELAAAAAAARAKAEAPAGEAAPAQGGEAAPASN